MERQGDLPALLDYQPRMVLSGCGIRLRIAGHQRAPVSHNLRGGLGDIRDDQHAKEDAQEMKSYPPAVHWKTADCRVKVDRKEVKQNRYGKRTT
jgi:hypothetical protein